VKRTANVILGLITVLIVVVCDFIWGYAPLRDQRLDVKNARFMADFRAKANENEFSRPGVAEQVPKYFKTSNWDLEAALDRICKGIFSFPIVILQADGDPAQPVSIFEDVPRQCPNVELRWIKDASHFSNLDQPEEVARAISEFVNRDK
jgi:pimeloyl-ACP methyl ester carboxylesterase